MSHIRAAYLLCTNPRSGSWMLAEGLRATGVVGRPEEYFNPSLRALYLRDFKLPARTSPATLLATMLRAGTTPNGVFAAKVHRLNYAAMLDLLRDATGEHDADEVDLLTGVFPNLVLVHHDRADRVGQALSWHRALATDNWWHVPGRRDIRAEGDVRLDVDRVAALERRLEQDDAAWRELFARASLPVIPSTYEDLVSDYAGTLRRVVRAVGGPADVAISAPPLARQSDRTTDRWRAEYLRRARSRRTRAGASIVVVSHNEGSNLARTVSGLRTTTPAGTEIVVVDDCSTDGSVDDLRAADLDVVVVRAPRRLGVAGSRNAGAEASEGDVVVFSDAHVDVADGWLPPLLDELSDGEVGAVAPTVADRSDPSVRGYGFTWPNLGMAVRWLRAAPEGPGDVPFLCGCFLALRRDTFDELGGFDDGMMRWGSEDAELSLRLWRSGLACRVVPQSVVGHLFRPAFGYAVAWEHTLHNMLRLATLHLDAELVAVALDRMIEQPAVPAAIALLDLPDIDERRRAAERASWRPGRAVLEQFGIPVTAEAAA